MTPPSDTPEYRKAYRRGWKAGNSSAYGSLDNATMRGEPDAWYDGYMDKAIGREMWHSLTCEGCPSCEPTPVNSILAGGH